MNRILAFALLWIGVGLARAQVFTRIDGVAVSTSPGDASGASWVDYDGDGDFDIYVSNRNIGAHLYRNDGAGAFAKVFLNQLTSRSSIGSCWADYDNDGDIDGFTAGTPSFLYRNDGGSFIDATSALGNTNVRGWACAWADYDQDGFADLVVTHPAGFVGAARTNYLFRNQGDGTLREVAGDPVSDGQAPYTVATWSDYDDDGDQDLFIAAGPANGTRARDFLYHNELTETGRATFTRITTGRIATDLQDGQVWRWIDWDNDGDLDAYLTNYWGGNSSGMANSMYRNDEGTYVNVTNQTIGTDLGLSLANVWADFDNDADLDLFVANDASGRGGLNRFYRNDGAGNFERVSLGALTTDRARRWGGTGADMDDDGDIDLFVPSLINNINQSMDFLYRNDLDNGNHWLKVRLVASSSNGSALGAVVRATSKGVTQRRDVSSQDTFNGQGMLDVHFGLGASDAVARLEITWPSGEVDTISDVATGQTLVVLEGSTATAVEPIAEIPQADASLTLYPNPAASYFVVKTEGRLGQVRVLDLLGRTVLAASSQDSQVQLDTSGLIPGIYSVEVSGDHGKRGARQLVIAR